MWQARSGTTRLASFCESTDRTGNGLSQRLPFVDWPPFPSSCTLTSAPTLPWTIAVGVSLAKNKAREIDSLHNSITHQPLVSPFPELYQDRHPQRVFDPPVRLSFVFGRLQSLRSDNLWRGYPWLQRYGSRN